MQRASHDVPRTGELTAPQSVPEHREVRPAGAILGTGVEATERWLHAEHRKERCRREHLLHRHHPVNVGDRVRARGSPPAGDSAERAGLVAQIDVVGIGAHPDVDQAVDVPDVRGRPEQQRIHEAEHRHVGADPQSKGEDDGEREPGTAGECAERVAEVIHIVAPP